MKNHTYKLESGISRAVTFSGNMIFMQKCDGVVKVTDGESLDVDMVSGMKITLPTKFKNLWFESSSPQVINFYIGEGDVELSSGGGASGSGAKNTAIKTASKTDNTSAGRVKLVDYSKNRNEVSVSVIGGLGIQLYGDANTIDSQGMKIFAGGAINLEYCGALYYKNINDNAVSTVQILELF